MIERRIGEHVLLLDDDMAETLSSRRISVHNNKNMLYARSGRLYIHRLVMHAKRGQLVDHINGNGLDNRRVNLRLANHQTNKANQYHCKNKTSKYIGVSVTKYGTFRVQMKTDGKNRSFGGFHSEAEAAFFYDRMAKKLYGESATLNFDLRI